MQFHAWQCTGSRRTLLTPPPLQAGTSRWIRRKVGKGGALRVWKQELTTRPSDQQHPEDPDTLPKSFKWSEALHYISLYLATTSIAQILP